MRAMKRVVCLVAAGVAVASAVPAFARDHDGDGWRGRWHRDVVVRHYEPVHRHFYSPRPVYVVRDAPVYYSAPAQFEHRMVH